MRLDLGLLVLRTLSAGMMFFCHGLLKLKSFSVLAATFNDPLGLGPTTSLVLAIGAEVFCSVLVFIGLATRLAAVPLVITMLTAATIVHANDPWSKKEFALLYAIPFLTLIFTGPGMFSIDGLIKSRPRAVRP